MCIKLSENIQRNHMRTLNLYNVLCHQFFGALIKVCTYGTQSKTTRVFEKHESAKIVFYRYVYVYDLKKYCFVCQLMIMYTS